jgi:hypothetical protein
MGDRDDVLAFLGLPEWATLSEIEDAFSIRFARANDRLVSGDESARVELAALNEAYERLMGRPPGQLIARRTELADREAEEESEATYVGPPAWWECYLSLLLALAATAALASVAAYLPHIYNHGGVLLPFALLVLTALLSILATMLADPELQYGTRARLLASRGLESGYESVRLRWYTARLSSLLSRIVRWLIVPAAITVIGVNFASLSGRWSLRH